jgi:hypothetical protein
MLLHCALQGAFGKWLEGRGVAEQAMHSHSRWLQDFRQQVADVAAKLPQQRRPQPVAAAVGGSSLPAVSAVLSPVASVHSLLGGPEASRGSLPVTVDLGGDQELVISVVHKAAPAPVAEDAASAAPAAPAAAASANAAAAEEAAPPLS